LTINIFGLVTGENHIIKTNHYEAFDSQAGKLLTFLSKYL